MSLTKLRLPVFALSLLFGTAVGANAQAMTATGSEGWFVRGELGVVSLATNEGYWWGPGGPPGDPRITFSLNDPMTLTGAGGVGYDWGNGVRVDGTVGILGSLQVDGTFLSASNGTTTGHATDIHGAASAFAVLGNLYIEPLRLAGYDSSFQPFLTGGVGFAVVSTGEWNRNAPLAPNPARSWNGSSQNNLAWTAGAGVSIALEDLIGGTGFLDLAYRYTDLGQAQGGSVSTGPGGSSPTEPFNFRLASHAVTLGLRIPLGN